MKKAIWFLFFLLISISFIHAYPGDLLSGRKGKIRKHNKFTTAILSMSANSDHAPVWFADLGTDLYHAQAKLDGLYYPSSGLEYEGYVGGVAVSVGAYVPIFTFSDDFSAGATSNIMVSLAPGSFIGAKLPIYACIHAGKGSASDNSTNWTFAAGAGLAFQFLHFNDSFEYSYLQCTPALMIQGGVSDYVFRLEYMLRTQKETFDSASTASFQNLSFTWVLFFPYRSYYEE
jgi:hypothetical protein